MSKRQRLSISILAAGVLGLASLASAQEESGTEPPPTGQTETGPVDPAAPDFWPSGAAPDNGAQPVPSAPAPAAPVPKVGDLEGLLQGDLRARLGEPKLTRDELPAIVWQYPTAGCVLFVYFYPPEGGGAPRVNYVEASTRHGARVDADVCLREVIGIGQPLNLPAQQP